MRTLFVVSLLSMVLAGCAGPDDLPEETRPDVDWAAVVAARDAADRVSYADDVQPILEQRCVVCHGCYDAPCQLKLSAFEGLQRGGNPDKVYDGARISAAEPTRLFIDGINEEGWRMKGFHSVLGGAAEPGVAPDERLRESVLYRLLRLKQLNPQPRTGVLPAAYTLNLDRKQECADDATIARFERRNPLWGMPYAMPNLSDQEYGTLVRWLAEGAEAPAATPLPAGVVTQVDEWERFLNGTTPKQLLMSRYLFEHLFLGHLYFRGEHERVFFRLVRSYTPPGEPVREIPTVRPFEYPGERFWYRLRHYDAAIVAKAHVPYELSPQRLTRFRELFMDPDYAVAALPGYEMPDSGNPFLTFADIPPQSRYRFMLDDARFFIQGFIKGPVCRGQVALNVIEDHFWVVFANPDKPGAEDRKAVLDAVAGYLKAPTDKETLNLLATYTRFWDGQKAYLAAKSDYLAETLAASTDGDALDWIWDGDGDNRNAALTVFRHFDSAAVEFGFQGDYPETAWVIDYPLLERIHYLLVAAFDVYGNIGHQLNSRLFMDFLRMEGEDNFLLFLPPAERKAVRDEWYRGIRESRSKYFAEPMDWLNLEMPITYTSANPQAEFYRMLEAHLGAITGSDPLNRCTADCDYAERPFEARLRRLAAISGEHAQIFPDVSFIRVRGEDGSDHAYTLVLNKMYFSLEGIFSDGESGKRDATRDTLALLRGFRGSYPNFFFVVPEAAVDDFVTMAAAVRTSEDYQAFVARYGVRRTRQDLWAQADWFAQRYAETEPVEAGIFDLNRYQNH